MRFVARVKRSETRERPVKSQGQTPDFADAPSGLHEREETH
jgi:hypothetical protein